MSSIFEKNIRFVTDDLQFNSLTKFKTNIHRFPLYIFQRILAFRTHCFIFFRIISLLIIFNNKQYSVLFSDFKFEQY